MNIGTYRRLMLFSSVVFVFITGYILYSTSPDTSSVGTLVSLYLCIFTLIFLVLSLALSFIPTKGHSQISMGRSVQVSTRRALLSAIFVISLMFLGSINLLTWWDAALLAFSLALFELYFKTNKGRLN